MEDGRTAGPDAGQGRPARRDEPLPGEQDRRRLVSLLGDGHLGGARFLNRLREMRSLEGISACAGIIQLLAHLELTEAEAERLLADVLRHRDAMVRRLGRDPGVQVAALDFLTAVRPMLRNPAFIEVSPLEQSERRAMTDPQTDLYDLRHFQRSLAIESRRATRHRRPLSLLLFDLDSFSSVNDLYGHPFGDKVLRRAARLVRRTLRDSDTVCRARDERIWAILPETGRLAAAAAGERVRRAIELGFADSPIDGRLVAMTISGGVASFPEDGDVPGALTERAEQALDRAKLRGRNRIVMHHHERRRSPRFPVSPATGAALAAAAEGAARPARALDLAAGGAWVETDGSRDWREKEALVLTLAHARGRAVLPGRVLRVEQRPQRIAVAFDRPLPAADLAGAVTFRSARADGAGGAR